MDLNLASAISNNGATPNMGHAYELQAGVEKLRDGRYSDFTITCGERQWRVHKVVLSAMSPVLEKSCFGGFKESMESRLDLSVYSEEEVACLVSYIYTGDYNTSTAEYACSELALHVKMHIVGNYFSIAGLETLTTSRFDTLMKAGAGIEQIVEVAAVAATAPGPTQSIQQIIVDCVSEWPMLYNGQDGDLLKIARVNAELAINIAEEERGKLMGATKRSGSAGYKWTRLVCPEAACGRAFTALYPGNDALEMVSCCYCGEQTPAILFRVAAPLRTHRTGKKRRRA